MAATHRLERTQRIERPLPEVFAFFADAANLEAITPQFLRFRILTRPPIEMREGALIDYEISLLGVPMQWHTRIAVWEPNVRFVDEQLVGPYAYWHHTHAFEAQGNATLMRDTVLYREPFGPLGAVAHTLFVARTLARIFDYRQAAIEREFSNPAAPDTARTARA
ncbi:MAG: SRPBCC family protein [Polyangiaceae bacterium]